MREEELKDNAMVSLAIVVGATGVFLVLLVAVMTLAFWRRRKMKNHFYIPSSQSQRDDLPLWDLESLDNESGKTPVPANISTACRLTPRGRRSWLPKRIRLHS